MNNQETKEYTIPANLLQAIVNNLNEQPARLSREILNVLVQVCSKQDEAAAAKVKADELAAAIAERTSEV